MGVGFTHSRFHRWRIETSGRVVVFRGQFEHSQVQLREVFAAGHSIQNAAQSALVLFWLAIVGRERTGNAIRCELSRR